MIDRTASFDSGMRQLHFVLIGVAAVLLPVTLGFVTINGGMNASILKLPLNQSV
jgi:hypothetical protein